MEAEAVPEAKTEKPESNLASRIRGTAGFLEWCYLPNTRTYPSFVDYFLPQLTVEKRELSRKKSAVVIATLYLSHALSAWVSRANYACVHTANGRG